MNSSLATNFGTIGHDIMGIAGGFFTLLTDIITAATGGTAKPQNAPQYPWSG